MKNDNEIKKEAIIDSTIAQVRELLEKHFRSICKSAEDSFIDDDTLAEPKAKVTLAIEFDTLSTAPEISVKIGWSVRYKDESAEEIDPLQSKLGLPDAEETK
jgi:hypothetical protein